MIVTSHGRSASHRTAQEIEGDLAHRINSLSPEELQCLQELIKNDSPELNVVYKQAVTEEYDRAFIGVDRWLEDEYYSGEYGKALYPQLRKDLKELFEGGYSEAIFSGSIGWGKSFLSSIGVIRMLYEISCLRNPQRTYGLADGDNIVFASISVNVKVAQLVIFEGIEERLKNIPYFRNEFKPRKFGGDLRFPKNILLQAGSSTDTSIIGLNIFGGIVDEINFLRSRSIQQKASHARWGHIDRAENLYAAIVRRMKSRYMRSGRVPGILFLVSSKRTVNDFTERRIRESKSDPTVFVKEYSTWAVKPKSAFSNDKFRVLVGNDRIRSRILAEDENPEIPPGSEVTIIDVPEDFRGDFERDLPGAIRDSAGLATQTYSSYIQKPEKIHEMHKNESRKHPFTVMEYDPSLPGDFIWSQLARVNTDGEWEPLLNPNAPRHVHIDPSLSGDSTGLCCGHISHHVEVIRKKGQGSDEHVKEMAPVYVVDFILRIVPPVGDEIQTKSVRKLIYELSAHGFHIKLTTTDSFLAPAYSQPLQDKGYRCDTVSVDTSLVPYENVKTALYENRIKCYEYKPLEYELAHLEYDRDRNKVDHAPDNGKDVSDALAGCLYTLSTIKNVQPIAPELGLSEYKAQTRAGASMEEDVDEDWVLDKKSIMVTDETVLPEKPKRREPLMPLT